MLSEGGAIVMLVVVVGYLLEIKAFIQIYIVQNGVTDYNVG